MDERNDHDILICLEVKLKLLQKSFDNHIKHHWLITVPLIVVSLGSVLSLVITLLTK